MTSAVLEAVPDYGRLRPESLRKNVEQTTFVFVKDIDGKPGGSVEWDRLRAEGAEWARNGVGVDDLNTAMDAGVEAGLSFVGDLAADLELPPREVASLMAGVAVSVTKSNRAVREARLQGFLDGHREQVPEDAAAAVAWVDRVLTSSHDEWPEVERDGSPFHPDQHAAFGLAVVLGRRGAPLQAVREAVHEMCVQTDGAIEGPSRVDRVPHVVALVGLPDPVAWPTTLEAIESSLEGRGALLLSPAETTPLTEVARLYASCKRLVPYAWVVPSPRARLNLGALQCSRLLDSAPEVERISLFQSVLGALVRHDRSRDLLDFADALAALGSIRAAQEALGISSGTATARQKAIADATGLSWPEHSQEIGNAVVCRRLAARSRTGYEEAVWGSRPRTRYESGS